MTSAYQQQLAQQLRAAEDELGRLRRERASLIERTQLAEAGARERAALLEHARDLLEPWGGHGDAWPDIAPAIETLIARAEQAEARIAAVRSVHRCSTLHDVVQDQAAYCVNCRFAWPCPTAAALDGATYQPTR